MEDLLSHRLSKDFFFTATWAGLSFVSATTAGGFCGSGDGFECNLAFCKSCAGDLEMCLFLFCFWFVWLFGDVCFLVVFGEVRTCTFTQDYI